MKVSTSFAFFVLVIFVSSLLSLEYGWRKGVEDCLNSGSLCAQMYEGAK